MSEFDEKCSKCRNYNGNILICESCAHYRPKPTVFQKITTSPEALAEEFVEPYTRWGEDGHLETLRRSNFRELSGMLFDTKEEAFTATVEKFKEVTE